MAFNFLPNFIYGAALVSNAAAFLLGALFVLTLALAGLVIFAALAGWLFDKATARISARYASKGIKPKGRIARVICDNGVRDV